MMSDSTNSHRDAVQSKPDHTITDEYDRYHPVGEGGQIICPWCGGSLDPVQMGVTVDGRRAPACNLTRGFVIRVYHPRCRRKRRVLKERVLCCPFDQIEIE